MKITLLTTKLNLESGGGSNIALDLKARELKNMGFEVKVVVCLQQEKIPGHAPYQILVEEIKSTNPRKNLEEIENILKKHEKETDVYIVDGHFFIWGAALYKKNKGKSKVIVDLFSFLESANFFNENPVRFDIRRTIGLAIQRIWGRQFAKNHLRYIDFFTYTSPVIKKFYAKFGIREDQMALIPPFVDIETNPTFRHSESDDIGIIFVGRLSRYKGIELLLKAVALIPNKKINLDVIGDGPDRDRLGEIARKLNLTNIKWHGFVPRNKLHEYYEKATILVHPTIDPEPFGMSVLEGMKFGLPVITSENSGSAWLIGDGGLVFKNGNYKDLCNKILELCDNIELRREMGLKALERAKYFDYKKWADELKKIIVKLEQ